MDRLSLCIALLLAGAVWAEGPASAPVSLKATITGVEGIVQVREREDGPWKKAAVGMVLGEGAEFRTGPRSAVRFEIPPDQTITLDRLGTVKLMEAVARAGGIKTDLGMKYGRVRYDIEAAGVEHDSTIHSPASSLAVRGTKVSLYDQPPFAPQAISLTGRAAFRNAKKQRVAFGGKGHKSQISGEATSSAETSLNGAVIRSQALERTEQQLREMSFLSTHQGVVFGNVAYSTTRVMDAELPGLISGKLDFVLRWSAPEPADLNLVVHTPRGEVFGNPPFILSLFPDNPQVGKLLRENFPQSSSSGGQMGLNSIGPEGIEIASFPKSHPTGLYTLGVYNFIYSETKLDPEGKTSVPFTVEAFLNGKRQPLLLNLDAVSAGTEQPKFGFVFHDSVAVGDLKGTATYIGPEKQATRRTAAKPATAKTIAATRRR